MTRRTITNDPSFLFRFVLSAANLFLLLLVLLSNMDRVTSFVPLSITSTPVAVVRQPLHSGRRYRYNYVTSSSSSSSISSSTAAVMRSAVATTATRLQQSTNSDSEDDVDSILRALDECLNVDHPKINSAIRFLKEHPSLSLPEQHWKQIFDAIETRTAQAEENIITDTNTDTDLARLPQSPARTEMTNMYAILKERGDLRLYGALGDTGNTVATTTSGDVVSGSTNTAMRTNIPPIGGSRIITPSLLEQITELPMTALTPKPSNNLLFAGAVLCAMEAALSAQTGIDFNLLVAITLVGAFFDKLLVNGALFESILQLFLPNISKKILKHEAGHFLCAYLMGCPVEGCVLTAWAALQDARFGGRRLGVSAGTSFFDPLLSKQIQSSFVTNSSIDRYTIIVMAGIAAEAIHYGGADGGAGDEAALVAFLAQLNNNSSNNIPPPWNEKSIKNQARWGALSAVLLLKEYKDCYEALVDALERGGNLGDCVYAIEKAGRDKNLQPLQEPMVYIQDEGEFGKWSKTAPEGILLESYEYSTAVGQQQWQRQQQHQEEKPIDTRSTEQVVQESEQALREDKKMMEEKLQKIDDRLKDMDAML